MQLGPHLEKRAWPGEPQPSTSLDSITAPMEGEGRAASEAEHSSSVDNLQDAIMEASTIPFLLPRGKIDACVVAIVLFLSPQGLSIRCRRV